MLALLGLSGAILVHRDAWIGLPHAGDARIVNPELIASATARIMADPGTRPRSILYASDSFGLARLSYEKGAGAYADQSGTIVTRWESEWERPEIWLSDFHHHLFAGDAGEWVIGIAGLAGLFFVISGTILWWRTRRTFSPRLWPRRMSRPMILMHHRDLGIVVAPMLLVSLYTGTVMIFRPVSVLALGPGTPAAVAQALKPPEAPGVALSHEIDWAAIVRTAHARFPEAQIRLLGLPGDDDGLITVRMKQPDEWLPNGRTLAWFAADDGRLLASRDARSHSLQVKGYNMLYPLHAAKVGGFGYRLLMTLSGIALTLLGSLAVWSFWLKGGRSRR